MQSKKSNSGRVRLVTSTIAMLCNRWVRLPYSPHMKVYLHPNTNSKGIVRVADALTKYMPSSCELVDYASEADLEIIHVIGRRDTLQRRIDKINREHRHYAMIQYVLRSSKNPDCHDWIDMWNGAKLVWSYYDLKELCNADEIDDTRFGFYYAPLGVDSTVFKDLKIVNKPFIVGACSKHALAEGARECAFASKITYKKMFFLGHELRRGNDIVCKSKLTDGQVAIYWNQCRFVSGLRRIEGFEFPVIEGALCGAIPIVYDRPEMRKWFNEFAIFIPEGTRDQVIDYLTNIFLVDGVMSITQSMKDLIKDRFNWETIIKGFWERIL